MGGRMALHVALAHPEAVDRLVLISTNPGIQGHEARRKRRASDEALARRIETQGLSAFLRWWLAQPLFATLAPSAAGLGERLANTEEGLASSLRLAGLGSQDPLWDRLGELGERGLPVLLVAGELDSAYRSHAERMAAAIGPSARLQVIEGAGHACHLERPGQLAAAIAAFAATAPPGATGQL
jgi:2-succinyl-6-hydroxy-2,4-cyclohexadiene-1-carboxylate synthase